MKVGRLGLIYLAGGASFVVAWLFTFLLIAAMPGGADPGANWGIGDRAVNLIVLSGGTFAAGFAIGRLAGTDRIWIVILTTWLPALLAQWVAWMILGTSDLDSESVVIVAVALALGQGVAIRLRSHEPPPVPASERS